MGSTRPDRLPLFPLNVVLLPGALLPLHIFEPRYRQMVNRCVAENSEFGMVLALPDGVVRVGCTATIRDVVKRYPDGRMDILAVGGLPFRVVELFTENPLIEGDVDYLDDEDMRGAEANPSELTALYETCHTLIFKDCPKEIAAEPANELAYRVADALPVDLLWKQQILELRSEAERRERLAAYLREWAPHLQRKVAVRKAAGGNGHGLN